MMLLKSIFYYTISTALIALLLTVSACDDDDNNEPDNSDAGRKTTGFVVVGTTASGNALVKYTEELPTSTFNLSDGNDFTSFDPRAIYDHAMFVRGPVQEDRWSKYIVNNEGEFVETGFIPTAERNPFRLSIRDSELGVFQDLATPDEITVFNPSTMERTGSTIDMTGGFTPDDVPQRYTQFYFRGDDVFAPVDGGPNDAFTEFIVHQANLITNAFVGDTRREGNGRAEITIFTNYLIFGNTDEEGNLYIPDLGNVEGGGVPARINKIPAGSNEIDPDYIFEPTVLLDPENVFLPAINSFHVISNGRALARVNAFTPQEAIDIVTNAGGANELSPDEERQVLSILFSTASAQWCLLDLNAMEVTPISGIPNVQVFNRRDIFEYEGNYYLPVVGGEDGNNAYYRYNPDTGSAEKAFDVTGATVVGVYNLENNSQ